MIRKLLFLLLMAAPFFALAETFEVEVGGNLSVTPYYEPAHITINLGDVVQWNFVLGTHNVTSTSGPESFASGDLVSPNMFSYTFDLAGTYFYECTLFNHAVTQNGSITVLDLPDAIAESDIENAISIFPNPAVDVLNITSDINPNIQSVKLIDINGSEALSIIWKEEYNSISLEGLASGLYIAIIQTSNGTIRRRIQIEK